MSVPAVPHGLVPGGVERRRADPDLAGSAAADALFVPGQTTRGRRDLKRRRMLVLADGLAIAFAWSLAILVNGRGGGAAAAVAVAALPIWLLLHRALGLYDAEVSRINRSTVDELGTLLLSVVLGASVLFLVVPPLAGIELPRRVIWAFAAFGCVAVPVGRSIARHAVRLTSSRERVLIVGGGPTGAMLTDKLKRRGEHGAYVVGYLDRRRTPEVGAPWLGPHTDLELVCRDQRVERVLVAFGLNNDGLLEVVRTCRTLGVKVGILPRLFDVVGQRVLTDSVEGLTLLSLRNVSRSRSALWCKRLIDVVGAGAGLLVLAPVLAVIAVAIATTSPGGVLYGQRRVGRGDAPFTMLKFRSMVAGADAMKADLSDANEADGIMFKMADDPRVTRVGRILRRTSLDELPQLWNVLRGEMSLVGPRPLVPEEANHVLGWHRTRLELTPGLTGPWQVTGRTAIPFAEMVKLDYLYVAEWSLWGDVRLLLRTLPEVLFARGQ